MTRLVILSWLSISLFGVVLSPDAMSSPLSGTWTTQYRGNIQVYICQDMFTSTFPTWSLGQLASNVRSVIDEWNIYGKADFKFVYSGFRTGSGNGCSVGGYPGTGEVLVKASTAAGMTFPLCSKTTFWRELPNITRGSVSLYRDCWTGGPSVSWTFDHALSGTTDVDSALRQSIGGVLGFPYDTQPTVLSVMDDPLGFWSRVLWYTDIYYLTSSYETHHYSSTSGQTIMHKISNDAGLIWNNENLATHYTNTRIGVGGPLSYDNRYFIGWDDASSNALHIASTNGLQITFEQSLQTTLGGPTIASNGSLAVAAYTSLNSPRQILWTWASFLGGFGSSWFGLLNVPGSMYEPSLAYDYVNENWLLAFATQSTDILTGSDQLCGRIDLCFTPDPTSPGSTPFAGCNLGPYTDSPPAIACSISNGCVIAYTEHTGINDFNIKVGRLVYRGLGGYAVQNPTDLIDSTTIGTSIASGIYGQNEYYVLGWRGTSSSLSGYTMRVLESSFPGFGSKRTIDSGLAYSPGVGFDPSYQNEFEYYYSRQ